MMINMIRTSSSKSLVFKREEFLSRGLLETSLRQLFSPSVVFRTLPHKEPSGVKEGKKGKKEREKERERGREREREREGKST
jgi:hypothetical protein